MNSHQRYMAVLEGKPVDFIPRTPILMQFAAEYVGSNYAEFASDHRCLVKANTACARDFGMDQVSCISDPYRETHGFGSIIEYRKDSPPWSTHPLESNRDLSILDKPDPLKSERMRDRIEAAELYRKQFQGQYSILGWVEGPAAEAADLRNISPFLLDLIEDQDYACELMDRCLETAIEFAGAQIQAGVDTIGIGDAVASLVSPDLYQRLILPRENDLVNSVKNMGALVKLHICGNITHLLQGISRLNIDIIDVDHMVDIVKVRETLGDNVTITGNIDPVSGVLDGTPEGIREIMSNTYARVGNPYMVNAGCEIPPGTPEENLRALCDPLPFCG